jgi:hypothetical protein
MNTLENNNSLEKRIIELSTPNNSILIHKQEIYKNDHKIVISKMTKNTNYNIYFNHLSLKKIMNNLLDNILLNVLQNIIMEYLENYIFVICITYCEDYDEDGLCTKIIIVYDNIQFEFVYGGMFNKELNTDTIEFTKQLFNITDVLGEDVLNIQDKVLSNHFSSLINYKYMFEEYVKYFGNINNERIENYLSKLDRKNCDCTDVGFRCYYNTSKYIDNKFVVYRTSCKGNSHISLYMTVKDHQLLKYIIEIIKILHDDDIFKHFSSELENGSE